MRKTFLVVSLAAAALFLQGCLFAPGINSIQKAGLTESGRRGSLDDTVKSFQTALFWENYPLAQDYVAPDKVEDVRAKLKEKREDGRIVESKVEAVNYYDDSYRAEVDLMVKVKDSDTMLVTPQSERQVWVFSVYDGWKLDKIDDQES